MLRTARAFYTTYSKERERKLLLHFSPELLLFYWPDYIAVTSENRGQSGTRHVDGFYDLCILRQIINTSIFGGSYKPLKAENDRMGASSCWSPPSTCS